VARRHLLAGAEFLSQARYEDARESFALALEARPLDEEALDGLAVASWKLGDARAAAEYFRRALRRDPGDLDRMSGLARACAARAGESRALADSAAALFARVLAEDPGRAELYLEAASVHDVLGDLPASIMLEMEALAAGSHGAKAPPLPARKLLRAKLYAEAFRAYAARVAEDTTDTESLRVHARLLMRLDRLRTAVRAYETILRREPASTTAIQERRNLAECLRRLGRWEEAARCGEALAAAEPGILRNHREAAEAWLEAGRPLESIRAADRALAANEDWLCLWFVRGRALEEQARREEAEGRTARSLFLLVEARENLARAAGEPDCGDSARRAVERVQDRVSRLSGENARAPERTERGPARDGEGSARGAPPPGSREGGGR
jgi:tetratricopeptide (TPR) repeat protein